jgi:4-carboxymuconolactone decarboxylase
MTVDDRRLPPLKPANWPSVLDRIKQGLVEPLNIHSIMAHHPDLLKAWMPLREHVVKNNSLEARHQELIVLRTAVNTDAQYEWKHHIIRGRVAGLSDEEMERVKKGASAPQWSAAERALVKAADDIFHHSQISDATYEALNNHFDSKQQLDLLVTVGMYLTLASIIKTFDLPMEET